MSDTNTQIKHPGCYLAQILAEQEITQAELAFILGQSPNNINAIIQAKRGVSPGMSKMLGEALQVSGDYFANLQTEYDLLLASEPDPTVSLRADMLKTYPIREMIKRQWIEDGTAEVLQSELARFFDVSNTNEIPYLAHAAKKGKYAKDDVTPAQYAWLFRVREIARVLAVPRYSEKKLRDIAEDMRELLLSPEEARNVPRLISECGVRFVIVETIPQAKIDGVCFWLDKQSPVIGMSMRYDRIDNFWFVLRHEIEHVLNKHGMSKAVVDDLDVKGDLAAEEVTANIAASDFCVPADRMESFMRRKYPAYYEKDVLAFSKLHGIHPGLVVGQIQNKMDKYDYLRKYLVKIRHCVLPGSIVDGWGMSAPIRSAI